MFCAVQNASLMIKSTELEYWNGCNKNFHLNLKSSYEALDPVTKELTNWAMKLANKPEFHGRTKHFKKA